MSHPVTTVDNVYTFTIVTAKLPNFDLKVRRNRKGQLKLMEIL